MPSAEKDAECAILIKIRQTIRFVFFKKKNERFAFQMASWLICATHYSMGRQLEGVDSLSRAVHKRTATKMS